MNNDLITNYPSNITHTDCVKAANSYIAKRYPVTLPEFYCYNTELPDVIGFKRDCSVVVECKVSRGDFHADKKKTFRMKPEDGMGDYRFYCCPKGMIKKEELPAGWGLLYIYPSGQVREIKQSYLPAAEGADLSKDWLRGGKFTKNKDAELHLLFYYARRAFYAGVHGTVLAYRGIDG